MIWIYRLLIAAILALMVGCLLGALLLIIEEKRDARERRARIRRAIDRIASPHILPIEDLDAVRDAYHNGATHACMKGDNDNVDSKKQD